MFLLLKDQGVIAIGRIIAIAPYDPAPIRRLLNSLPEEQIIVMTSGKRRSAVIILDSGHAVICAETPERLWQRLHDEEVMT